MSLLQRLRALLKRFFFWHGDAAHSHEFVPEHGHDHALVLQVASTPKVPRWRQLRYAGRVLNTKERRLLLVMSALLIVTAGAGAVLLVRARMLPVPAVGGRVVEAVVGQPKYPHPFYAATNDPDQDLVSLVYAGLFRRVNGSTAVPDLAAQYEWTENGTKLIIKLRDNIRFHDGTPVTADDVVFTLTAAMDPAWKSSYVNVLRDMEVVRVDDRTVELTPKRANAELFDTLTLGILPAHIWQDIPPGSALLADANVRPIGAGPFRIRSFTRDARGAIAAYTLERNDQYHGIKPYVDQLEVRFFPDLTQAADALRNGQVDTLAFIPGPSVSALTSHERISASTLELPQETIAFFNLNDGLLKDVAVRQALALAADRTEVAEAQAPRDARGDLMDVAAPVNGPFPFTPFVAATSTPEERLDQARRILDGAGWIVPPEGSLRIRKGTASSTASASSTLHMTITVPDVPDLVAVANVLQRRWSLLGAKIDIRAEEPGALARRVTVNRDAQILIWNVLLSPSQDPYPVWWSGEATGHGLNLSNLSDRNVDDAIEAIRAATTTDMLAAARDVMTQAVLARTPAVFLTRPAYGYVHNIRVKGMTPRLQLGTPSDRFTDISNWYVNTGWRWK